MKTKTVRAKKVREGDFLPGLDDGYVFAQPERNPVMPVGGYGNAIHEGTVLIAFHDADGNENHLLCGKDMRIVVRR